MRWGPKTCNRPHRIDIQAVPNPPTLDEKFWRRRLLRVSASVPQHRAEDLSAGDGGCPCAARRRDDDPVAGRPGTCWPDVAVDRQRHRVGSPNSVVGQRIQYRSAWSSGRGSVRALQGAGHWFGPGPPVAPSAASSRRGAGDLRGDSGCAVTDGGVDGRLPKAHPELDPGAPPFCSPGCAATTPCMATDTGLHRGEGSASHREHEEQQLEHVVANNSPLTGPKPEGVTSPRSEWKCQLPGDDWICRRR